MAAKARELTIRAVRPWDSLDAESGAAKVETYDQQDKINFCMEHCPYAECVNCIDGGKNAAMGRPKLVSDDDLELLRWRLTLKAADGDICREMGIDASLLRRCKRKIGRTKQCGT